ncbi:head decoration protein [Roseomonas aerophila]|uniref:Head decoration protein n=1 Tax=Teichococcus aerophilus TaxID=1224513 RepID=A0ABR7RS51_9PROT|nr:head decoration protein [Pseudoroseomonas aerophila]MBC9208932.1 head decoration protein [Pseudoroseomonas aerophila]
MATPVLNERFYNGAFLVSEANGTRSRDTVVMKNAGGTDLVLDGGLVLATLTADGSVVPYDNAGTDGSEVASCILYGQVIVPAGGQKRVTIVSRDAEVNASELIWAAGVDAAGKAAGLADLLTKGIVAR